MDSEERLGFWWLTGHKGGPTRETRLRPGPVSARAEKCWPRARVCCVSLEAESDHNKLCIRRTYYSLVMAFKPRRDFSCSHLIRLTLRRRSSAVRFQLGEAGGGFGDEPCDRCGYSRVVGWCGNGWFGWPGHGNECCVGGWMSSTSSRSEPLMGPLARSVRWCIGTRFLVSGFQPRRVFTAHGGALSATWC